MGARREMHLLLFALATIGILGGAGARPSGGEGELEEYPVYDVLETQKQSDGSPGSAGSEGTFASWWANRRPCSCGNSRCACCTGTLFPLPPWLRPRVCTNLTYIEDEFAVKMAVSFNDVVMYRNKLSGRNPPPVCISPPRIQRAKLCIKLQDVYLIDRNMHACLTVEGLYNSQVLFGRMLGCMRMGAGGFAVLNPEDGGGLPSAETDPEDEEPNDEDDYDQVDETYDQVDENYDQVDVENTIEGAEGSESGAGEATGGQSGGQRVVEKTKVPVESVTGAVKDSGTVGTSKRPALETTKEAEGSVKTAVSEDVVTNTGIAESVKTTEFENATVVEEKVNTTAIEETTMVTESAETTTVEELQNSTTTETPIQGEEEIEMSGGAAHEVSTENPAKAAEEESGVSDKSQSKEEEMKSVEEGDFAGVLKVEENPEGAEGSPGEIMEKVKTVPEPLSVVEGTSKAEEDVSDGEIVGVGTVEEL